MARLIGGPPRWVDIPETFKSEEAAWEEITEEKSFVKIGAPVRQVSKVLKELPSGGQGSARRQWRPFVRNLGSVRSHYDRAEKACDQRLSTKRASPSPASAFRRSRRAPPCAWLRRR